MARFCAYTPDDPYAAGRFARAFDKVCTADHLTAATANAQSAIDRCPSPLPSEFGVDEHFMVAQLKCGALGGAGGTVRYQPEFRKVFA